MKFLTIVCLVCTYFCLTYAVKDARCIQSPGKKGTGFISCFAYVPSWTYYASSNECKFFVFGGCGGNENRFGSKEHCEEECKD
ncbi:uncharacterized protein Dwil_GK27864 [Drosophila willistoni]|uniref:BPTI/Kunitz inhibitor domain-containing protein n=1 Tax=Drosophila willistoni TaxID=7260 RepID=A0A0Q9WZ79_DROWI|nr:kunitz-like peptide PcKuz1 [Drosophila willistoni]KRF98456.1 uncharacterized protein Dwil_GK27864 [Drosophila willistoni]